MLAAHADQVAAYRAGKEGLLGFFVGQVMKETGGAANPKLVGDMLQREAAGMSADPVAEANALLARARLPRAAARRARLADARAGCC